MIYNFNEFLNSLNEDMTKTGRWGHVGAGILPFCVETKRFLIPLRSDEVLEPNTYGVWGGKIDDEDEDIIEVAAKREFYEETGFEIELIIKSYVYKENGFEYHNFIGILDFEFEPLLDWETSDYKWVTFNELIEIEPKHFGLKLLIENSFEQLKDLVD